MRRIICLLMCFAVLLSLPVTSSFAAEGRTVVFRERIQASPGFTVAPGSQITLEVLPESFHPENNVSLDDFEFEWMLIKDNETISLGTGQKITTPPLQASFNKAEIAAYPTAKASAGIAAVKILVFNSHPEVTIVEDDEINASDCQFQPSSTVLRSRLTIAVPGTDPCLQSPYVIPPGDTEWTRKDNRDAPWESDLTSYQWYETDESGTPITGVIGSTVTFFPETYSTGTRYFMCKGYYGLQEAPGIARFTLKTIPCPAVETVLEPQRVTVGGSMAATALFDGQVIDTADPGFQQSFKKWVSENIGEEAECDMTRFFWERSTHDQPLGDGRTNPGKLENVTSRDADVAFRYEGESNYKSAAYEGEVYLNTPWAVLTVLDADGNIIPPQTSGSGSTIPDTDATTFENVFENGGHLTYTVLRDTLQLQPGMGLSIMRGDNDVDFDSWAATGDTFYVANGQGEVQSSGVIVILGDVMGTGTMSLSQVIRTAKAVTGVEPLEGVYAAAADFNGDNSIGITDLVQMANLFKASSSASREYVGKNHELL